MSVEQGFDRGVDFKKMKKNLKRAYKEANKEYDNLDKGDRYYKSKKRKIINRIIYILVSMIQLMNGSRISEACDALKQFLENDDYISKIVTKIAKSESTKKNKKGETYITKARHRNLKFPIEWIEIPDDLKDDLNEHFGIITEDKLKKRVLDYLLKHHNCNTHSLRYACINYLLYEKNLEPSIVAKFVGHSNMNQLVRYTQKKEVDKIFDIDL
jgi:integrase